MKTLSPLDAVTQFVTAMNQGDLETALSMYESGAADGNWLIALDNPWGADVVA